MKNTISRRTGSLLEQAHSALAGMTSDGDQLGLVMVNKETMRLKVDRLVAARDTLVDAVKELALARRAQKSVEKEARLLAMTSRDVLKARIGPVHDVRYEQAGFKRNLSVPRNMVDLQWMLAGLDSYFTANPTHEAEVLGVTAAVEKATLTRLRDAVAAVNRRKGKAKDLLKERNARLEDLRKDLKALTSELRLKLDPLSGIWEAFGFQRPGARNIPAVPENVTAEVVNETSVMVEWERPVRAEHYRVWIRVEGQGEFTPVTSRRQCDFLIQNLPPNTRVEVAVTAVNIGGETRFSEIKTVTTGQTV